MIAESAFRKLISRILFGLALGGLFGPAEAADKTFYFPEVRIDVTVEEDGSFRVDELRTYEFNGSFSWASLWIPLEIERRGYRHRVTLDEFSVLDEQGRPLRTEVDGSRKRFEAKWFYNARNHPLVDEYYQLHAWEK